MIRELAFALAAELESGHHRQTSKVLCDADGAKCCLGVATWMFGMTGELREFDGKQVFTYDHNDTCEVLPFPVADFFGFSSRQGQRLDTRPIVIDDVEYYCLASANDAGVPFPTIARYIRENYEFL